MRRLTGPTPRPGYTLIELLVVIAIIAVMVGLLVSGIQRFRGLGDKTMAGSEISQLDTAATNFKDKYKFYPPSQIAIVQAGVPRFQGFMFPHRIDMQEFNVFNRMYTRWLPGSTDLPMMPDGVTIDLATLGAPLPPAGTGRGRADYVALVQQTNTFVNPNARPLDPNQMMVLFLGGPGALFDPKASTPFPTTHGWDTVGPFVPQGNNKNGPYYEFKTSRQYADDDTWDGRFRDPWGTPYAYFSAVNADNYHDPRAFALAPPQLLVAKFPWDTSSPILATQKYNPATDPPTAHPLALSFQGSVVKWVNPGRFQIISAGRDRVFGPGTYNHPTFPTALDLWKPGQNFYGTAEPGDDDLANFNDGNGLGTPGSQ